MRILIIDLFGIMAGSTYSAAYQAQALQRIGHQVWVGYKKGTFLEDLVGEMNLQGIAFNAYGKMNFRIAWQISQKVKMHNIQLINSQGSPDRYLTAFAKLFFGMNVPLIHTRRQKPESGHLFKSWVFERITDRVVAVSSPIKQFLIDKGYSADHVKVIHNGIPKTKLNVNTEMIHELKERHDIKPNDIVVGCLSRIKKQHQILEAIISIEIPITVILVGISENHERLHEAIKMLPSQHRVIFTGEVENELALAYLKLFTIKILPSDMEGFSQSILEAMILGVPVIATKASGNVETISHGRTGFLFDDHSIEDLSAQIIKLIESKDLRRKIAQSAEEYALSNYLMEAMAKKYEAFYEELISP